MNNEYIKTHSISRLIFFISIVVLFFIGCNGGEWDEKALSSFTATTEPSGYLQVSAFPGDFVANIGEEVTIGCSIIPVINTPVEIYSVDLALFDSTDSLIREEPMDIEDYWSANVTYTIVGDEASNREESGVSIKRTTPEQSSHFTEKFIIKTVSSLITTTEPSGYLQVSVSPGDIVADSGEQVTISCFIMPLINTPVEIYSVDLAIFDSTDSLIREEPMDIEDYWSANVTYTIMGDEAYYCFLIDFRVNPLNPEYFSEYTDTFSIEFNP